MKQEESSKTTAILDKTIFKSLFSYLDTCGLPDIFFFSSKGYQIKNFIKRYQVVW